MQYREIGKTGLKASILGYGCMRFPVVDGKNDCIDRDKASQLLRRAYELGVNYYDTAFIYHGGNSEGFIGETFRDVRDKVIFTTKLWSPEVKSESDMDRLLDMQLERLGTSWLDFFLLHSLHRAFWDNLKAANVLKFLDRAKADGRIRHAGFSFHDSYQMFEEIMGSFDWELVQLQHNYLQREYQAGEKGMADAAASGAGIVIMEPLHGGDLARENPHLTPVWEESGIRRSPAGWGLRYLWSRPDVSVVLSGMSTMEQLEENAALASSPEMTAPLSDQESAALDKAAQVLRSMEQIPCTSCSYCMPCPFGVNIPGNFGLYNRAMMFNGAADLAGRYSEMAGKKEAAKNCKKCGACAAKCPQKLDIPDMLEKVDACFTK